MTCLHVNATITLYEEKITEYALREGTIEEIDDDIEAQPLHRASVDCPDCGLKVSYPDWRLAPEPCLSAIGRVYRQEYGSLIENYTLADTTVLNALKNRLREITKMLDASQNVYPNTLEASQVKHETMILLTELQVHGLLHAGVTISSDPIPTHDPIPAQEEQVTLPEKKGVYYVTVTIVSLGKAMPMPMERVEGTFEDVEKWVHENYDPDEVIKVVIEGPKWPNK
jgi:hypothetical protein